jgi:hypothetical protein
VSEACACCYDRVGVERTNTTFAKLNEGWNAEPGAPYPELQVQGWSLVLTFYLNPWVFPQFKPGDVGELTFSDCWRYRLGPTNDEGWWRGQCRFSRRAPEWGEFYEVTGDLRLERIPNDAWTTIGEPTNKETRHFLFYFKDETFECDAAGWNFRVIAGSHEFPGARAISLPSGSSATLIPPRSSHKR